MSDRDRKLKWKWRGPKEWRPARPEQWLESPLLSKEENERVSLLFGLSKKYGANITPAEVDWLCQTIQKLAQVSPDDYSFPDHLALFNQITQQAYAMRYKETLLIEFSHHFRGPFLGATLLSHIISSRPPEAVTVIRPYVKIVPPADPAAVLGLRGSTICMEVDGEKVLRTPIDEHLIFGDGSFPRKNRWTFRSSRNSCVYLACPLVGGQAYVAIPKGIMCANGTVITVKLFRSPQFEGEITLTTGLVAAMYGTADSPARTAEVIP